jgi:hypothetical protein
MKAILKTLPKELDMKYNEKFRSEENARILEQLVPRLITSMRPRYKSSHKKVTKWLSSLHKHRRVRFLYKERGTLDKDNRRLHRNNRLNEVIFLLLLLLFSKLANIRNIRLNIEKNTQNKRRKRALSKRRIGRIRPRGDVKNPVRQQVPFPRSLGD